MATARLPRRPRLDQLNLVVEQLREQVAALAACECADDRAARAAGILEDLCEVEHLLAIHQGHLERTMRE